MLISHEAIMSALFTLLQNSVVVSLTGNTAIGSPTVSNLSTTDGLFNGLPVFGVGVPAGASISSFDPVGMTLTLSTPATANGTGVSLATGFQTAGRRVLLWSKVSAQPALFLRLMADEDVYHDIILSRTTLEAEVWIYCKSKDPDLPPSTLLNNLIDAVRYALRPDNMMLRQQTLGGLVNFCRIEGRSEFDPGDLDMDGQAKAVLPLKIMAP
jgi:hypothetical protein